MKKPSVYIASKIPHSKKIINIMLKNSDIYFSCRWPYLESIVEPTQENAENFWISDFDDIDNADYVILYLEDDDIPRGALIEVGYGIAKGKTILVHGSNPYHGTWHFHHQVHRCDTLDECLNFVRYGVPHLMNVV